MTLTQQTLDMILSKISHHRTTLADVIIMAVEGASTTGSHPGDIHGISLHIKDLLNALHSHNLIREKVSAWAHTTMLKMYM